MSSAAIADFQGHTVKSASTEPGRLIGRHPLRLDALEPMLTVEFAFERSLLQNGLRQLGC